MSKKYFAGQCRYAIIRHAMGNVTPHLDRRSVQTTESDGISPGLSIGKRYPRANSHETTVPGTLSERSSESELSAVEIIYD